MSSDWVFWSTDVNNRSNFGRSWIVGEKKPSPDLNYWIQLQSLLAFPYMYIVLPSPWSFEDQNINFTSNALVIYKKETNIINFNKNEIQSTPCITIDKIDWVQKTITWHSDVKLILNVNVHVDILIIFVQLIFLPFLTLINRQIFYPSLFDYSWQFRACCAMFKTAESPKNKITLQSNRVHFIHKNVVQVVRHIFW